MTKEKIQDILKNKEDLPKYLKTNHPDLWLKLAWQKVNSWRDGIRIQNNLLGETADFEKELFTLDPIASNTVFYAFQKYYQDDLIYKGSYLVNWSVGLQTAVSDIAGEIEYEKKVDPFVTFEYKIQLIDPNSELRKTSQETKDFLLEYTKPCNLLKGVPVSTVRPETVFGDVALAIHPNRFSEYFNLNIFQQNKLGYKEVTALEVLELIKQGIFPVYFHIPELEIKKVRLIISDKVEENFGTGALKITPGSDKFDYDLYYEFLKKNWYNFDFSQAVGRDGKLTEIAGEFAGLKVEESRPRIIKRLIETGYVPKKVDFVLAKNPEEIQEISDTELFELPIEKQYQYLAKKYPEYQINWNYEHNVAICERSKTVIEPLISEEFFVSFSQEFTKNNFIKDYLESKQNSKNTLLIGTSNKSKITRYKNQLKNLNLNLISFKDLNLDLNPPEEVGLSCLENAKNKAKFYFKKTKTPCFAIDTGLYFEGVEEFEQPGKNVKGIADVNETTTPSQSFEKMTQFYSNLATKYGGQLKGYFLDAYCLFDGKNIFTTEVKRSIVLTNQIHHRDEHFPICSLYTVKGKPYHDLNETEMKEFLYESVFALEGLIEDWLAEKKNQNKKTTLQKLGLEGVNEINFYSEDYRERAINFLENIKDWCISRNLLWGHKIPVWYNLKINPEKRFYSYKEIESLKVKNQTLPMLISQTKPNLEGDWQQEAKILDTWFSSSLWPLSTLNLPEFAKSLTFNSSHYKDGSYFEKFYPTTDMFTSKEIFYIWIVRMIVLGKYFTGIIPFKNLIITPTVLDEHGRKMSKSLGNGLDPVKAISDFSSDSLRLTMLSSFFPNRNFRLGGQIANQQMEKYRNFNTKILNVANFLFSEKKNS